MSTPFTWISSALLALAGAALIVIGQPTFAAAAIALGWGISTIAWHEDVKRAEARADARAAWREREHVLKTLSATLAAGASPGDWAKAYGSYVAAHAVLEGIPVTWPPSERGQNGDERSE